MNGTVAGPDEPYTLLVLLIHAIPWELKVIRVCIQSKRWPCCATLILGGYKSFFGTAAIVPDPGKTEKSPFQVLVSIAESSIIQEKTLRPLSRSNEGINATLFAKGSGERLQLFEARVLSSLHTGKTFRKAFGIAVREGVLRNWP